MTEAQRKDDRLKVFISYSRDDLEFADQLDAILRLAGFETVLDRHGIQAGEAWEKRLGELLRSADTVVFVLSPSSVKSKTCGWELEEAARLGKRILPVACRPLGHEDSPPPLLAALNYIFFYPEPRKSGTGFAPGLTDLAAALNTDLGWLREHTRYLQRAVEWDSRGRPGNRLLSGSDITDAKDWAARRPRDAPEPTALHLDFIRASEQEEALRSNAERLRLEEMAAAQAERATALQAAEGALKDKQLAQRREAEASRRVVQRTRIGLAAALVLAAVTSAAGVYAFHQKGIAQEKTHEAEAATERLAHEYLALLAEASVDDLLDRSAVPGEITVAESAAWTPLVKRDGPTFGVARPFQLGRVLAVAHDGVLAQLDTDRKIGLLKRAFAWLGGPRGNRSVAIATGHCEWVPTRAASELATLLKESGHAVIELSGVIEEANLKGVNVLVIGNAWGDLADSEIQAVERFVSAGGGLMGAGLGWSWQTYSGQAGYRCEGKNQGQKVDDLATYPMNRLFKPFEMQWSAKS